MFDITTISKRYFGIKLTVTDEEDKEHVIELEVEPPKIKTLKQMLAVSKAADEDAMDELSAVVLKMLSKNKAKIKVPETYIDGLDYDQLEEIMTAYFNWITKEKSSPN